MWSPGCHSRLLHRRWEQLKMLVELFKCPVIWTQKTRPCPLDILSVWSPGAQEKKENFVLETSTFLSEFCVESCVLSEFPLGQDSQQRQIYLWNGLNIIKSASLLCIMSFREHSPSFYFWVDVFFHPLYHCVLAAVWDFHSMAKDLRKLKCAVWKSDMAVLWPARHFLG